MEQAGHEFLPSPALPQNQYGKGPLSDPKEHTIDIAYLSRYTYHGAGTASSFVG